MVTGCLPHGLCPCMPIPPHTSQLAAPTNLCVVFVSIVCYIQFVLCFQDSMDKFFTEEEPVETKMWRGLLYTIVGLGALATTVAVIR